jgi:hypothetical protein
MAQSGTVTLMFTDLGNSPAHLQQAGDEMGAHFFQNAPEPPCRPLRTRVGRARRESCRRSCISSTALGAVDEVLEATLLKPGGNAESFDFMAGWIRRTEQSNAIHASQ